MQRHLILGYLNIRWPSNNAKGDIEIKRERERKRERENKWAFILDCFAGFDAIYMQSSKLVFQAYPTHLVLYIQECCVSGLTINLHM